MLFNSLPFLIFFPVVVFLYFLIPKRAQYIWLLAASYFFYMSWNAKYALLLLFTTGITYIAGRIIEKKRGMLLAKAAVAGSLVLNLVILFLFKYFDFFLDNINRVLHILGIQVLSPAFDVVLPVGISFYTFQALGYTIDVYRGEVKAEKNFLKYALFISFFPQLVAGPIERSKNLLKQVNEKHSFQFERVREGLLLMLWGYFLKIVIADRIAIIVDTVYGNYETFGGYYLIVATILFAFQIYGDFSGYSTIAIGAAKIMGFELMENFDSPYLARSVTEFWRRWHISLSSWFRDYLYIPLGGNRKGTSRKYINLFLVFLASGMWHGASWAYIFWGGINGIYQIIGNWLKPFRERINQLFRLNKELIGHKIFQVVCTFCLIDFSWIFFRAGDLETALNAIKSMISVHNIWILFDGSLYQLGVDQKNFHVLLIALGILLFADVMKYYHICIRKVIMKQELWCRWLCYITAVIAVLLFGVWGGTYDATGFIYFQF